MTGIEALDSQCQAQIALKTDLSPLQDTSPRDRVALDTREAVNGIEEVQTSDAEWKLAERVIARDFGAREASRARTTHLELPAETPAPPVQIKHLYRETRIRLSSMYFVAEKQYSKALNPWDAGCKARTIMTGWLIRTADGGLAISSRQVFLSDCDAVEVRTAVALAVLHLDRRVFWILEEYGYEDTEYVLTEVTAAGVRRRLAVNGGGC